MILITMMKKEGERKGKNMRQGKKKIKIDEKKSLAKFNATRGICSYLIGLHCCVNLKSPILSFSF